MDYDIIVIGAGIAGLTAAAYATKEKKKVLLLEKGNYPGGFLTSFKRGRFEFETSLHTLTGFSKAQGIGDSRIIFDELGITQNLQILEPQNAFRVITTAKSGEKIDVTLPFGKDDFIAAVENAVPGSKTALEKFFMLCENAVDGINRFAQTDEKINVAFSKSLLKEHGNFIRTAPYSVNEVLNAINMPQKAKNIVSALWTMLGVDCDRLSFIHYATYFYSFIVLGTYIPKNRSSDISMSIADVIEDNGGHIRYNSPVARILYKNGCAEGVILKSGEKIFCKHIICNISPTTVYSKMMKTDSVPVTAVKRSNARSFGMRGACLYLGLNRSAEDLGIKDYCYLITETADSAVQYDLMRMINTNNECIVTCINNVNADASPKGTSILTFTTHFSENCWANIEPENYFDEKNELAKRLINNFETVTGIKIFEYIEELEVATPLTFARFTNSPQGTIYGYLGDEWDSLFARFSTEIQDNDTKGLRFCGGYGTQLSGVSSSLASGRNALYATLFDINDWGDE